MRCLALAVLLPLCAVAEDAVSPPRAIYAEQITADNFHRAIRGAGADAGIGDWMMSNGTLCASVSAPAHETYLSVAGGSLIDLGYCGRDDDQWAAYHDLANLSREQVFLGQEVTTELTADAASLRVRARAGGLESVSSYTLSRAAPEELVIDTTIRRLQSGESLALFGSLILHTHRSMTPFVVSTTSPEASKGFQHPFVDTSDRSVLTRLLFPADLAVLIGPEVGAPEIAYGVLSAAPELVDTAGTHFVLRQFSIDDQDFSLIGNFARPLWFDTAAQPGLLQLGQVPFMDLAVGETLRIRRRILVSQRADAASVTDRVYGGGTIKGHTNSPRNRILVTDAAGHPLSFVQPAAGGEFSLRLPEGLTQAKLVLNTPFHDAALTRTATADDGARVELDSEHAEVRVELPGGKPMRLVFKGRNGTPDPRFLADLRGFEVGMKPIPADVSSNGVSLAGVAGDRRDLELPTGDYTVYATRGPEYSLEKTELELRSGVDTVLAIAAPHRVIRTRRWISADLHVHGEFSFDSTLPARDRVADFVAQGAEVMVSTEHKRIVDYQPLVQSMGLQHVLVTVTGTELTGMAHGDRIARTIGHDNVFPLRADPQQYQGGSLAHENRRLGEVIAEHRRLDPDIVFQLNHPRRIGYEKDDMYFFNHLSVDRRYDPAQPLDSDSNRSLIEPLPGTPYRDIDFDAIEVMNGGDMASYRAVRNDWFSLLQQGYRRTATANSDSHNTYDVVAMPRNMVRVEGPHADDEAVDRFDRAAFLAAIHHGKLFGTTGPFLEVRLGDKDMGETLAANQATLQVRVHAARWVPVERLRVFVNGTSVRELPAERKGRYEIPLHFDQDSFVTVEVEGSASGGYAAVYPGFTPLAFTNPIYVDADGDGKWSAPGLASGSTPTP